MSFGEEIEISSNLSFLTIESSICLPLAPNILHRASSRQMGNSAFVQALIFSKVSLLRGDTTSKAIVSGPKRRKAEGKLQDLTKSSSITLSVLAKNGVIDR